MSKRYSGALITKTPVVPTSLSAPGVWSLSDQAAAQATNTWPFRRDPQFNYVTMLLHGDGSAGAVPATGVGAGVSTTVTNFNADASTNNFNVTINGDARSDTFTPYQGSGYYSSLLGTNGNYFTSGTNAALGLSTGDWTIEFFVYINQFVDNQFIIDFRPSGSGGATQPLLWLTTGGALIYFTAGSVRITTSNSVVSLNTWTHIAVCKASGTTRVLVNGASVGSLSDSFDYGSSARFVNGTYGDAPGATNNNGGVISGYISNLRIVKGTALYTGSYTVPTAPLTAITNTSCLTHQSNRFIDNSGNNISITPSGSPSVSPAVPFTLPTSVATYGSGYFDGTGDSLNAPASSAQFSPGTSNLTVEGWYYFTNLSAGVTNLFGSNNGSGATQKMTAYIEANGTIHFDLTQAGGASQATSASGAVVNNTWYHLAFVRNSSTATIYVNGTSVASGSATGNLSALTNPFYVGYIGEAYGVLMSGYVSDFRYVNGTAVYTTTFTPPTAPLTAITNTKLLTTQYNGGGNNSGFKDSSQFNFPITRFGNTSQGTFTPYGANWSNYFNGTDAYWKQASSANYILGTNDFTLECWINVNSSSVTMRRLFGVGYGANGGSHGCSWEIQYTGSDSPTGQINVNRYDGSTSTSYATSGATIVVGQWHHIAVSRTGGNLRIFVDGVAYYNAANTFNFTQVTYGGNTELWTGLGYYGPAGGLGGPRYFGGYMSNIRIINGTGIYSSNFTPSTTPLTAITNTQLLTAQSNRFVDNSTNAQAITPSGSPSVQRFSQFAPLTVYNPTTYGGSGYFDGSGDYLTAGTTASNFLCTGSATGITATFEAWVYPTAYSTGGQPYLFSGVHTKGITYFNFGVRNGAVRFYWYDGATKNVDSASTSDVPLNAWTHICMTINGSTIKIYINGALSTTSTAYTGVQSAGAGTTEYIGTEGNGTYFFGYISGYRLTNTVVYSAAFTPPTASLTAITGTLLLVSTTNPAILDNSMMNNLETVGNAAVSTSVKKYGAASMVFDGSGDYLSTPDNPALDMGSASFTIEGWVYVTATSASLQTLVAKGTGANNQASYHIALNGSTWVYYLSGTGSTWSIANGVTIGTYTINTWQHIALVRNGSTFTPYLNGVAGTTTTSSTALFDSNKPFTVGGDDAGTSLLTGYIDDLRVTKGVARYTATFTVPDQAFPNG